jgi:hypothetical protein
MLFPLEEWNPFQYMPPLFHDPTPPFNDNVQLGVNVVKFLLAI